jgi:pyridinium-3,5-biscarboxylic acid mononucleotide sulfurtransferase
VLSPVRVPSHAPRPVSGLVAALRAEVASCGSAVVAFSGGIDSTVVLRIAADVLGANALGVTGISPSVAPAEAADAERIARALGAQLLFAETAELSRPGYVANGPDRCFHCKTELYAVCRTIADERGLRCILNGTNADDVGDWRPGLAAAADAHVRAPLLACGLSKEEVRAVGRHLGLPNWDKPALACLASRLPYGTSVTPERLAAVDSVERQLRGLGFRQVRARHHGNAVRLEVEPGRVAELQALGARGALDAAVTAAGFRAWSIEPEGFRSGRLNDALTRPA